VLLRWPRPAANSARIQCRYHSCVRERWLSRRAVFLHVGALLFVPFCVAATWWQITRAEDGNGLSYLYTFEWPVFALLGIYFWWQFLHTDYEAVGLRGMRNQEAARSATGTDPATATELATGTESATAGAASPTTTTTATPIRPQPAPSSASPWSPSMPSPLPVQDEEDPELAAYNARLAALASSGGKTWRKPEVHVARRPQ
jgi:hypothetical protein